jgi:hypothetical protein
MQSTFRILSEMDGTLAREARAPAAFKLPRLPYAMLAWIALLAAGALIGAAGGFEFQVRLGLVAAAAMHAMGCAFLIFAQNGGSRLAWRESAGLALSVAAAMWTLPVLSTTVFGAAAFWQPGLASISCVIALAMLLLFWSLRLSWVTGNSFSTSFWQVIFAHLIGSSALAVIFTMTLGLAAWLT